MIDLIKFSLLNQGSFFNIAKFIFIINYSRKLIVIGNYKDIQL